VVTIKDKQNLGLQIRQLNSTRST